MKIKSIVCLFLCICLLLTGCRPTRTTSKKPSAPVEGTTVTVYYVTNPVSIYYRYIESLIKRYNRMPDMPDTIEETEFKSYEDMAKAIEEGGMPDLIIFDDWYGSAANVDTVNLSQLIADGEIAALDDFLQQDASYDADYYVGGVMEAGQVDGVQYILPISLKTECLLTDESKLRTTILAELPDDYTSDELLELLLTDGEQNENRSLYWTIIATNQYSVYDIGSTMSNFLQGAGYLQPYEETVIPDEESFRRAIEYLRLCMTLYSDMHNGPDSRALGNLPLGELPDVFLESMANMNLPFIVQYFQSVYYAVTGQDVVLHLYPYLGTTDAYGVTLNCFAAIGADSEAKEGAYRVARALMDFEADTWAYISENSIMSWTTSVNLEVLKEQIDAARDSIAASYHWGSARFDKQKLSRSNAKQLTDWAENIRYANVPDPELSVLLEHYFGNYVFGLEDALNWDGVCRQFAADVAALKRN